MNNDAIELLAERVECLERENRRWRWGVCTLLIGGLVTVAGAAQLDKGPKAVEAEQFIVRDKDGKERIRLGLASDGSPALFMWNKAGADRVLFLSGSGKDRVDLSVVLDGGRHASNSPGLTLIGDKGTRINLNVDTTGLGPWLRFENEDGTFFEAPEKTFKKLAGK